MKKSVVIFAFALIFPFLSGCSNSLSDSREEKSLDFGSLEYVRSGERVNYTVLDVGSVSSAKVSVTGNGIEDEICVFCRVDVGMGSFKIEKIPVGKNRIITVQGIGADGKEISDAVLKAVVNIEPGENYIATINRSSSIKGFVYSALLENKEDISLFTETQEKQLEDVTPALEDCGNNLERINFILLAEDFKNSSLKDISAYILPEAYLKRLSMEESIESTAENPVFIVNAIYSDETKKDVTDKVEWQVEDGAILAVNAGKVDLTSAGKTRFRAIYIEENSTRYSPYANVEVVFEQAQNNFIYLDVSDSSASGVNYAKAGAAVVAWIWGNGLSSSWYSFEKFNEEYIRLEIPFGAEKMVVARGKELRYETSWSGLYKCWNQTEDLNVRNEISVGGETKTANTLKLNAWDKATGNWLYVDHGDSLVDSIYAKISMEPSEDDTGISSVTVNGSSVMISKRMFYTIPHEKENAEVKVAPNYSGAAVSISPSEIQPVEVGGFKEFVIKVTAKDGNSETYTLKVKRSSLEALNSEQNIKRCYVDDADEKTITIVYDLKTWEDSKENISKLTVRGSFTTVYNPAKKRWVEDEENFTLSYDANYNWYSLSVPYEKIKRPGFSGQPEYRFYKNGGQLDVPAFVEEKYRFRNSRDNMLILFKSDNEERISQIMQNSENALKIKELSEFNLENNEDRQRVSNFRQVPHAAKLFRSYHPFYPSHEQSPAEQVRLEQVQAFMQEKGIKSDINLCNDRSIMEGMRYSVGGNDYTVTIPEYYKKIMNAGCVLYVGDEKSGGNGIVPSANFVYYYSDSDLMKQWLSQICSFINEDKNQAPFLIHCEIGVDRTGVFCGILAALNGASWEEIKADYEKSCGMGIAEFRDSNILKYSFENMLNVSDITLVSDLQNAVQNYLVSSGCLTQSEITKMVNKLK